MGDAFFETLTGGTTPLEESRNELITSHMTEDEIFDLEVSFVGQLILKPEAIWNIELKPDWFMFEACGRIYHEITEMLANGERITVATLRHKFSDEKLKETILLARDMPYVPIEYCVNKIRENKNYRELLFGLDEARRKLDEEGAEETKSFIANLLVNIDAKNRATSSNDVIDEIIDSLEQQQESYSTGWGSFDEALGGGLIPGRLIAVSARKKVGKTNLATSIAYNLRVEGVKVGFISLELNNIELEKRHISRFFKFNENLFRVPSEDAREKARNYCIEAKKKLPNNLFYRHMPSSNEKAVKDAIAEMVGAYGCKVIFIDYLQKILNSDRRKNEAQFLQEFSDWLRGFASKNNVVIFTLVQENQEGNARGGEGILLACDSAFSLQREKREVGAMLKCLESRWTAYMDVGDIENKVPGLILEDKRGLYFYEADSNYEIRKIASEALETRGKVNDDN